LEENFKEVWTISITSADNDPVETKTILRAKEPTPENVA
jgi:hypothetical protein